MLVDTPGFDDTTQSVTDVLEMIAVFLAARYVVLIYFTVLSTQRLDRSRRPSTLGGFVHLQPISDLRVTGISGRNFKTIRKLCEKSTLENVVIVTTMWDKVSRGIGEARESELINYFFKPAIDKGAQFVRYHIPMRSVTHDIIRRITRNLPTSLRNQQGVVDETLYPEPNEPIRCHQLEAMREEIIQALIERDERVRREIEEMKACLDEKNQRMRIRIERMGMEMEQMKIEMEKMTALHDEPRGAMETEMRRMQERAFFFPS